MKHRNLISLFFTALIAFAPSGTRYIFYTGKIVGHSVEPGTVSIFAMQVVALIFCALVFLSHGWDELIKAFKSRATICAALVAVFALLSSFQAVDALAGVTAALNVVLGVAVYFAIVMFRPEPLEVLTAFVGGAVFQVLLGGYQFFTQSAFASKWLGMATHSAAQLGAFVVETDSGRWLRAYGSLSHPNIFGLYVGIGLLTCIGVAAFRGHGKHLMFYALMPLVTAGLLFSFSRSALLAVAAGFVWMTISAFGSEAAPTFRRIMAPAFMIIVITFSVLGYLYAEPLRTRTVAAGRLEAQSIGQRGSQFEDAMSLFSRHAITGVGVGQMPLALARESATERDWWLYDYVHNVPALILVETGLLGLVSWLGFVWFTLDIIRRRLTFRKATMSTGVTVYGAAFIALLTAAMFDHFLWSSWFGQLLFWSIAGLLRAAFLHFQDLHPKELS